MREYLIGRSMRLFVFLVGSMIWVGIWLTGFETVHWLLYAPPIFFYFAAITGICPGMIISRLVLGDTPQKNKV